MTIEEAYSHHPRMKQTQQTANGDCKDCPYKVNCELNLYAVNPCKAEERCELNTATLRYDIRKYQNPFTGKFEDTPVPDFFVRNPYLYKG